MNAYKSRVTGASKGSGEIEEDELLSSVEEDELELDSSEEEVLEVCSSEEEEVEMEDSSEEEEVELEIDSSVFEVEVSWLEELSVEIEISGIAQEERRMLQIKPRMRFGFMC